MMRNDLHNLADGLGLAALGVTSAIPEVIIEYPWARSVLVAAVCYLPPEHAMCNGIPPHGWVARVARSADYHTVLRDKLEPLAERIRQQYPDAKTQICVDTNPLPERKLAVLSGIAWRGKNGNVFVDGCGSYAAIGEIVTDIALEPDTPNLADHCGDCTACIKACPVGAITEPNVVDQWRCISALTQSSGIIPRHLRSMMGNNIYGCDICQEICPQNAGITPSCSDFAQDVFPGKCPDLISLINLSPAEFRKTLKDSSIGWIRRTRIRRNAAIAAGNNKCKEAVPALSRMLKDENTILRIHAAWALGKIRSIAALDALQDALKYQTDPIIHEEINLALSNQE